MIKNDLWIAERARQGMIRPFLQRETRHAEGLITPVISYGLSCYAYNIRLSPKEFKIFKHIPGKVVNPKRFNLGNLESVELEEDSDGSFFVLPAHSYGLGVAMEYLEIPCNVTVICLSKSTYARCGIMFNTTIVNAGWKGHLTLEFSNSSKADCKLFVNEGIVQLLFFEGEPCSNQYMGVYQDQLELVTAPRT